MNIFKYTLIAITGLTLISCAHTKKEQKDPFLYLENINSTKNLEWVKSENKMTNDKISNLPGFAENTKQALQILNSKKKIPWVYKGNYISPINPNLSLMLLSDGGKDALVVREFNLKNKEFVKDGFFIPEAKSTVNWIDDNTIYVSSKFGASSLTTSGYPRKVKILKRGQKIEDAKLVAETLESSLRAAVYIFTNKKSAFHVLYNALNFYESEKFFLDGNNQVKIDIPKKSSIIDITYKNLFIKLSEKWVVNERTFNADSVLAIGFDSNNKFILDYNQITEIYKAKPRSSILSISKLKDYILINELVNMKSRILYFDKYKNFKLTKTSIGEHVEPKVSYNDSQANQFTYNTNNFNQPSKLHYYNFDSKVNSVLKSLQHNFNAKGIIVKQRWTTSKDGTKVPYFLVGKKDVIEKGNAPTELYGYGGFNIKLAPRYSSLLGKLWLEKGGVYALANIRGGGEFGKKWHQAAILEKKQNSYDDFIAIAEDLIHQKITNPKKLAISGGSNGGLLVAAVMTQRPDLFALVNCSVPLLDMMRYHKLLAGASWMAEYGDPDKADQRKYILKYSPYQNLRSDAKYPMTFFYTSTKDDRVHPGHARKMVAKMKSMNIPNVFYYENLDGGHAGSTNTRETAYKYASKYTLMWDVLK